MKINLPLVLFISMAAVLVDAQICLPIQTDTIQTSSDIKTCDSHKLKIKQIAIPATLLATGIWASGNDWFDVLNTETRDELQENIDHRLTFDDFSQLTPSAAYLGLGWCGVKTTHNVGERAMMLATSSAIMAIMANGMKYSFGIRRPDGSTNNSFPSGHTATAFMGAELLRLEYKNPWIWVPGYMLAAGTGFMRMYNNRHWLSDVICGAGIGIFSAQAAYWLYPIVSQLLHHKAVCVAPTYNGNYAGVSLSLSF